MRKRKASLAKAKDNAPAAGADGRGDCRACAGRCCTYVVVQIPRPRRKVDVDEIRWFLAHDDVHVYIEGGDWHVQFHARCRHLTRHARCRIYADRFDVCRQHQTDECEMSDGDVTETLFRTTQEFDRWWAARQRRRRTPRRPRAGRARAASR